MKFVLSLSVGAYISSMALFFEWLGLATSISVVAFSILLFYLNKE